LGQKTSKNGQKMVKIRKKIGSKPDHKHFGFLPDTGYPEKKGIGFLPVKVNRKKMFRFFSG